MAVVPLPELQRLAQNLANERHDAYSERALSRAYEEYLARRRTPIAPFRLRVGEREYPTFYDLLAEANPPPGPIELRLDPPAAPGSAWEFLRPFQKMATDEDGTGMLFPLGDGPPVRTVQRFLLREHYLPRSRADEDRAAAGGSRVTLRTFLDDLRVGIRVCRSRGLLPFCVAVLTYYPEERVSYELDLLRSLLLADPRAGRLPAQRYVRRPARLSWHVDQVVGKGDMPLLASRCLQVLVESPGLTAVEVAHIFGGVRELMDSALQGLAARGVVTFDRRTGVYRPRLDAFLPPTTSSGVRAPEPPPAGSNPALRTSVQELIAAADARATCPLCGNPLGADHQGILCAKCQAEVSAA
ncbi:MAG TPA: hypothetical protein VMI55_01525 [Thermoplasmata archaeon]|nr:hypothetical protein [Thermoplasmata archaeon]